MNYRTLPRTIDEVCAALTKRGRPDLAQRVAYFASDADLEPEDAPLTVASALGFWAFFRAVEGIEPVNRIDMACSPEGRLSAYWDFADERRASIWFHNTERINFAAKDANGRWVDIDGGGDTGNQADVMAKLVEAGLFIWYQEAENGRNSPPSTTLPGTAGVAM